MTEPIQGFLTSATDTWLINEQEELVGLLEMAREQAFAPDEDPYRMHEERLVAITRELRGRGHAQADDAPLGLRDTELPATTQCLLQEVK